MDNRLVNITTADRELHVNRCLTCESWDADHTAEAAVRHATNNPGHVVETVWKVSELLVIGQVNWAEGLPPVMPARPQTEPGS